MCYLSYNDRKVLQALSDSSCGLSSDSIYYRTPLTRYEVSDSVSYLCHNGYIYRSWGRYYLTARCAVVVAPAIVCVPAVRVVYPPVPVLIKTEPPKPPKASYVDYLASCQQQYVFPMSAEAYAAS